MNQLTTVNQSVTMTSREIAELTGKDISAIHRDIRAMLTEIKKDDPNLNHPQEDKDSRGYTTCFYLNRELTETLLTGYSATARLKVIRRWHELENAAPRSPAELILAMAQQMVANEQRIAGLDTRLTQIEQKQVVKEQYLTVLEFAIAHGMATDKSTLQSMGIRASRASRSMGHEITTKHQDNKNFRGNVNAYHPDVLFSLVESFA